MSLPPGDEMSSLGPRSEVVGGMLLPAAAVLTTAIFAAEGSLLVRGLLAQRSDSAVPAALATLVLVVVTALVSVAAVALARGATKRPFSVSDALIAPAALAALLAVVPLPPSDFWTNGGTDYAMIQVPLASAAMVALSPLFGFLYRHRRPWPQAIGRVLSAAALGLCTYALLTDGFGSLELRLRALQGAVLAVVAAIACFVVPRRPAA